MRNLTLLKTSKNPLLDQVYADARQEMVRGVHPSGVHLFERRLYAQMLGAPGGFLGDPQQHPLITFVAARHLQGHHEVTTEQHQTGGGAFAQRSRAYAEPEQPETRAKVRVVAQSGQHVRHRHFVGKIKLILLR